MAKIFYDKVNHKEIYDVSGNKTLKSIKQEFGEFDYQEIELLGDEVATVKKGVLGKQKISSRIDPNEELIKKKIGENQRAKAIADLKQEGKLPMNFPEKQGG